MSRGGEEKVLAQLGLAFKGVANSVKQNADVPTRDFAEACQRINPIFGHLGMAFKFAKDDFVSKVEDLLQCAPEYPTLPLILEADMKAGTVREPGSHTRNLLRVVRGINMIKLLFEHLLSSDHASLKEAAQKSYEVALAPYHSWTIRQAVRLSLHTLPSRQQFLSRVGEDEFSWRPYAQEFVNDSDPVIKYVFRLFVENDLGTDW